jgi:hypothetical protein
VQVAGVGGEFAAADLGVEMFDVGERLVGGVAVRVGRGEAARVVAGAARPALQPKAVVALLRPARVPSAG